MVKTIKHKLTRKQKGGTNDDICNRNITIAQYAILNAIEACHENKRDTLNTILDSIIQILDNPIVADESLYSQPRIANAADVSLYSKPFPRNKSTLKQPLLIPQQQIYNTLDLEDALPPPPPPRRK